MFERVSQIDWAQLSHAYGSAEDIPALLRALQSTDLGDVEGAFYDCYGSLCHQGTIYSATAAAIPFLLEIVATPNIPHCDELLTFLGAVANGYGEPEDEAACIAALAEGAPLYLSLLKNEELKIRLAAAALIGTTKGKVPVRDILDIIQKEPEPNIRAVLWLSLGDTEEYPEQIQDEAFVELAWALRSSKQKKLSEQGGWREAKQSHETTKTLSNGTGFRVSPLTIGRLFGADVNMEAEYWCTESEGNHRQYFRLSVANKQMELLMAVRLVPIAGAFNALLGKLLEVQKTISSDELTLTFLLPLSAFCEEIQIEQNGELLVLSKVALEKN